VTTTDLEAAAASTVEEAGLGCRNLDELMECLAGCFARVEPRRQARKYVTGLIGDVPRKNCWALAERAGDATPDMMQRLLERACWDAFAMMAAVRAFAVGRLGDPADAVLVIDEPGQEKAGEHTAGVQRQYLGCAGRVANGINVVYASYAAPAGHAIIGARLYVPRGWAGDRERRRAAGIPDDLPFKTKPQLAAEMTRQVIGDGRCPPWVTGDEVYGRDASLRQALADHPPLPALVLVAAPPPSQSPVVPPASPAADQRSRSMIRSARTPPQEDGQHQERCSIVASILTMISSPSAPAVASHRCRPAHRKGAARHGRERTVRKGPSNAAGCLGC
jgi:DDE superfamily endonuclease